MNEPLYIKTMKGKRVTYIPYVRPLNQQHEIDTETVYSIFTVVLVSFMGTMIDQLAPHSRQSREIRKMAEQLAAFSRLHHEKIDGGNVERGLAVWDAMIKEMVKQVNIDYEAAA